MPTAKQSNFLLGSILPVLIIGVLAAISVPKSLTGDEALTVTLCKDSFDTVVRNVARESHVPGYHILLWGWIHIFGSSLPVLRIFAFLPVGFLVYAGCRHFGKYGLLVLAVSPFLLHLAVELRMYGLMAAIGMFILILLQKLMKDFSVKTYSLLVLVCAAGVWVHYFVWCGVAAAAIILFIRRRKLASVILVTVCLIAVIPWIPNLAEQIHRFDPNGESASIDLFELATPVQRVMGVPFSVAGTLLRFTAGNAVFEFNLFSIRNMSVWSAAGMALLGLALLSAWRGRKTAGAGVFVMLLFVMLPVSLLRPTARHFAVAFPAYAALVIAGLDGPGRTGKLLRILIPAFSVLLCIPFITRTTMPQRCTFDRDFRETAITAGTAAMEYDEPLVLYLDTHSLMGVLYHMEDEGMTGTGIEIVHPHEERFSSGWFFYVEPMDILAYLMQDTDSLVQQWGEDFLLLANDPTQARGPLFGDENKIVGRGSDTVADLDLIICLERHFTLERIPLPHSEGPLTLFRVTSGN